MRMVNAASPPVGLLNGSSFVSQNVPFQQASGCVTVPSTNNGISYVVRGSSLPVPVSFFARQVTVFVTTVPSGQGFIFQPLDVELTSVPTEPTVTIVNSTVASRFDVHLLAPAAALGAPSVTDIGAGTRSMTGVTAGTWVVRVTDVGTTNVRVTLPERAFSNGQHTAVVIAPPDTIAGSGVRAFYWPMSSC